MQKNISSKNIKKISLFPEINGKTLWTELSGNIVGLIVSTLPWIKKIDTLNKTKLYLVDNVTFNEYANAVIGLKNVLNQLSLTAADIHSNIASVSERLQLFNKTHYDNCQISSNLSQPIESIEEFELCNHIYEESNNQIQKPKAKRKKTFETESVCYESNIQLSPSAVSKYCETPKITRSVETLTDLYIKGKNIQIIKDLTDQDETENVYIIDNNSVESSDEQLAVATNQSNEQPNETWSTKFQMASLILNYLQTKVINLDYKIKEISRTRSLQNFNAAFEMPSWKNTTPKTKVYIRSKESPIPEKASVYKRSYLSQPRGYFLVRTSRQSSPRLIQERNNFMFPRQTPQIPRNYTENCRKVWR